jgi:hypothetical protein
MPYAKVSNVDLGWFAGIIDGEGSITIVVHTGEHLPDFTPKLIVNNTSQELMEKFREIFYRIGGKWEKIYTNKRPLKKGGHCRYEFFCSDMAALRKTLQKILPHLTAKRQQAKLMLEFIRNKQAHKYGYTQQEIDIIKKLRELNGGRNLSQVDAVIEVRNHPIRKG